MRGREPASDLVSGLMVPPFPGGATVEEALVFVKSVDPEGGYYWTFHESPGVCGEEVLGALMSSMDLLREHLVADWSD